MRNSSWPAETGGATGGLVTEICARNATANAGAVLAAVTGGAAPQGVLTGAAKPVDAPAVTTAHAPASRHGVSRAAALIQVAASLVWLPQAALIAYAIGNIANGAPARAALAPAAAVLALGLLRAGLDALGVRRAFQSARDALSARRALACDALAARSPMDAGRPASGAAAAIIGEQAEAVQTYLTRFQPARLKASLTPIAILICVAPFSWVAALILLVAAPLIPMFMALIGWRAQAASEAQLVEVGAMNAFLLDRLRGLATIRTLGAVNATATRLRVNAEAVRSATMAVLRIAFLSSAVLELFAALGVALVAVYIGFHLLGELPFGAWGEKLSLAQGLFILLLAPAFFDPLRELSAVWHDRAAGEAAIVALDALSGGSDGAPFMLLPGHAGAPPVPETAQQGHPNPKRPIPLAVTARNLAFRYPGAATPAFPEGFNLEVRAGERIALLGPSGGGKSTVLALLAGLARPDAGTITTGGAPLDETSAQVIRRRIAWVGQQPHIFTGSMHANITLGRSAGAQEAMSRVNAALVWANLAELAATRDGAIIGENGVGLSGGEALRLALARAAFNDDAGLVLADEPTAHLDRATADAITASLLDLAQGRTLIVATHDPELASRMDRVIDMTPTCKEAQP